MKIKKILILLPFLAFAVNISAQLVLPSIFSDNMVLQRDMKIPVWGKSASEAQVAVWFHGQKRITTADKEGNWKIYLPPISADNNPQKMLVESDNSKIIFTNVLVGEVWLCSGQSNMGFSLKNAFNAEKYISEATNSNIRTFYTSIYNFKPYECDNCLGDWRICTTNSVKNLTAVGYLFGLELLKKLNVPIGLIQIEFGGTIIESWMNSEDLEKWDVYKESLASLDKYKNAKRFAYLKEKEKNEWYDKLKTIDPGFKNNWMTQNINDSDWKKIKLPHAWDTKYLEGHKGIVWYHKKINIPSGWSDKNLVVSFGLIRGTDIMWLNGKEIGNSLEGYFSHWNRLYNVPGNKFKTGENTIVFCNISNDGHAGPRGPKSLMKIYQENAHSNSIQLAGEWLCKKGYKGSRIPQKPLALSLWQETYSVHYNSRIYPVMPFAIRGVIWYQGESNRHNSDRYEDLFTAMINGWRAKWGEGNFPFYFVQIAPYNYGPKYNSAFVQEAQFHALKLTNTGMAVTMDVGNIKNIHPKNKKAVGHRLALWALAKDYGFTNLVYSGPLYKNYKIEGDKIIISFDFAKGLKTRDGKPLTYFEIAGKDKEFHPAEAKIVNDKIVVSSKKVENPVAVRFAWSNDAEPNLCNVTGLPASTFRTDNWK